MRAKSGTDVPPDVVEAASHLRVLIGQLARRMRAESGSYAVTLMQSSVLSRLQNDGPTTPSALARAERVRPQSMGAALDALEEEGLVRRSPHATDRRQLVMSLTPKGRKVLAAERASRQAWLTRAIAAELRPAEQRQLIAAIGLLDRLVRLP